MQYTSFQVHFPDQMVQNLTYTCALVGLNVRLDVCKPHVLLCSLDNGLENQCSGGEELVDLVMSSNRHWADDWRSGTVSQGPHVCLATTVAVPHLLLGDVHNLKYISKIFGFQQNCCLEICQFSIRLPDASVHVTDCMW